MRLLSQGSDGIFEVALASTVWLTPERAPTASAIAVAFATILLPFTVLGPFVGLLVDRWSRLVPRGQQRRPCGSAADHGPARRPRRVGWLFYLLLLTAFWVNRFLLAALFEHSPRRRR